MACLACSAEQGPKKVVPQACQRMSDNNPAFSDLWGDLFTACCDVHFVQHDIFMPEAPYTPYVLYINVTKLMRAPQRFSEKDGDYVLPYQRLWTFDVLVCPLLATERFLSQPLICETVFYRTSLLPPSLCIFCCGVNNTFILTVVRLNPALIIILSSI